MSVNVTITLHEIGEKKFEGVRMWGPTGSWFYVVDALGRVHYFPEGLVAWVQVDAAKGASIVNIKGIGQIRRQTAFGGQPDDHSGPWDGNP